MDRRPVSFRPLDVKDLTLKEQITLQSGIDAKHNTKNSNGIVHLTDEVRSSVIRLSIPVINEVLAGGNAEYVARFLGIKPKLVEEILKSNAALVYDETQQKYVITDSVSNEDLCSDYMLGTKALIYLVENFDHKKALMDIAHSLVVKLFSNHKDTIDTIGTISNTPDKDSILLFANYYYNINDRPAFNTYTHHNWQSILNTNVDLLLKGTTSRVAMLLNTPVDYTYKVGEHSTNLDITSRILGRYPRIMNMFLSYVVVLPTTLHMSIGGKSNTRKDPLTTLYEEVLDANMNFESVLALPALNIQTYKAAYDRLQNAVTRLLSREPRESQHRPNPNEKSIIKHLAEKNGQIRRFNLGKRQDYSGRAVVTAAPFLSLDRINIPEDMIPKIYQYHLLPHLQQRIEDAPADSPLKGKSLTNLDDPILHKEMLKIADEINLLENVPLYMGRQPTLHKLSVQAFYIQKSPTNAIQVNPLVCPAYNMDFDGDAGHLEVPLGERAISEVKNLLLTTRNIFLPKNGESTIEPRMDMLYGLFICTRNINYKNANSVQRNDYKDENDVFQKVVQNKYKVWDKVTVNGQLMTAGDAAFIACFKKGDIIGRKSLDNKVVRENHNSQHAYVTEITDKNIGDYVDFILRRVNGKFVYPLGNSTREGQCGTDTFVGSINKMVELGFKVARLYPPTITLIDSVHKGSAEYENCIDELYEETKKSDFAYALGLETSDMHKSVFTSALSKVSKTINNNIVDTLNENDGYKLMAISGARGKTSNLYQIFKYKGQIKKDDNTSFDAIVENSYRDQLTPFEHFICAYGGRQGQMDKSLKTGDIGYASRQMWHATQGYVITEVDCGTTMGTPVDRDYINQMYSPEDVEDFMVRMLEGHFELYPDGSTSNQPITHDEAIRMVTESNAKTHWIRTPYTCKNPCCQKCYGIDWSTYELAIPGLNVGIIAAQSIGEPATQLTMKQFQKGGVANATDVSSAFDRVNAYITCKNLTDNYSGYDPVAWESGPIHVLPYKDVTRVTLMIGRSTVERNVSKNIVLKANSSGTPIASKGYGMSIQPGDMDLNELTDVGGIQWAQRYFVGKLYDIYSDQAKIKMIHFEILAASLTRFKIISTNRSDIMCGLFCSAQELYNKESTIVTPVENGYKVISSPFYSVTPNNPDVVISLNEVLNQSSYTICIPRFVSVKNVIQSSHEALDNIEMESIKAGLARINMFNLTDSFTKPINRMLLAKPIITGTEVQGFMETRAQQI